MKEHKERAERAEINGIMKSIPVIKKLMEEKKLNQKTLGDMFGYSQSNINKCLKQGFTLPMLYRIAERFDLSLDYLTGRRSSGMSETECRFKERARELFGFIAFSRDKQGLPVNVRADGAGPVEITYDKAAERLGMTPDELRKYLEKNDVSCFLTMEQIEKLANFFHVTLDYLFNRKTEAFSALEKSEIAERLAQDQYVSFAEVAADGRVYPAFYFPEDPGTEKQGLFSRQTKLCHNIAINKYLKNCMDARQKLKDELYDQETYNAVMGAYRKQLRQRLLDPQIMTAEAVLDASRKQIRRRLPDLQIVTAEAKKAKAGREAEEWPLSQNTWQFPRSKKARAGREAEEWDEAAFNCIREGDYQDKEERGEVACLDDRGDEEEWDEAAFHDEEERGEAAFQEDDYQDEEERAEAAFSCIQEEDYRDEEKRAEAEFSRYANTAAPGTENKDS